MPFCESIFFAGSRQHRELYDLLDAGALGFFHHIHFQLGLILCNGP